MFLLLPYVKLKTLTRSFQIGTICQNKINANDDADFAKALNGSIATAWVDACAEVYENILFKDHFRTDFTIKTKFDPNNTMHSSAMTIVNNNNENKENDIDSDVKSDEKIDDNIPESKENTKKQFKNNKNNPNNKNDENKTDSNNNNNNNNNTNNSLIQTPTSLLEIKESQSSEAELSDNEVNDKKQTEQKKRLKNNEKNSDDKKINIDKIESREFLCHEIIPWSRCEIFEAMLDGNFKESNERSVFINDVKSSVFETFLKFLYTSHADFDDLLTLELLILSDRFRVERLLTWCEYRMSKIVEKACENQIEKSSMDVIGLLLISQKYNAKQLESFLLHFISTNYVAMKKRKEFKLLKDDNLKYIEKNRWPPKWYEDKCIQYEKDLNEWNKKYGKKKKKGNKNDDKDEGCLIM